MTCPTPCTDRLAHDGRGRPGGRQGCAVATDSHGNVYVVWEDTVHTRRFSWSARSTAAATFGKPQAIADVTDVGIFDGVRSISFDGIAGARTSSFPSLSIANGTPTVVGAPDTLAVGWSDGAGGLNHEHALVQLSDDGGRDLERRRPRWRSQRRPTRLRLPGHLAGRPGPLRRLRRVPDRFRNDTTCRPEFLGVLTCT